MGVRMVPSTERQARSTGPPSVLADRFWLRRIDLLILPAVYLFDVLVFSKLLRVDGITGAERAGILVYSAIGVGLLVFRRFAPVLVFCAAWLHSMLALILTDAYFPVLILLVALAAVAELRSLTISLIALGAILLPSALLVVAAADQAAEQSRVTAAVGAAVFYTVIGVLAWGIGRWARRHQRGLQVLQQQHTLEVQEQRVEAENAVLAERLRIARELHDIVAHSVTIMVLHAAGAKRVVSSDPDRAMESLTTIEESGKQAMAELRRLLELLHENVGEPVRSGSPLPGLAQLEQVVDTVRASGLTVALDITGRPAKLDTSIDLAAYRLVQEGLTNVTKHAGEGANVTVSVEWGSDKVTVAVEDDGAGVPRVPNSISTGNGLAGLRERVAIAGGEFVAGPVDTGGFRVAARLPVTPPGSVPGAGRDADRPEPDQVEPVVGLPLQPGRNQEDRPALPGRARSDP